MRRFLTISISMLFLVAIVGLNQTAMDAADFTGIWYTSNDQDKYVFEDGLIYSSKELGSAPDSKPISGAYSFCKNSIFLFVQDVDGLNKEKELYLIKRGDSCILCENEDGSGKVYFIRYQK